MGEALITRRGGGKKITTATEINPSWSSSTNMYSFLIEADGIYTVSFTDNEVAYADVIVDGESLCGFAEINNNYAHVAAQTSLHDIKVYRLE